MVGLSVLGGGMAKYFGFLMSASYCVSRSRAPKHQPRMQKNSKKLCSPGGHRGPVAREILHLQAVRGAQALQSGVDIVQAIRARHGPLRHAWVAGQVAAPVARQFIEQALQGPVDSYQHALQPAILVGRQGSDTLRTAVK